MSSRDEVARRMAYIEGMFVKVQGTQGEKEVIDKVMDYI
jgi:hypothetical protein